MVIQEHVEMVSDGIPQAAQLIGKVMDASDKPLELQSLANLGNYLWFRLQQKNAHAINESTAERKHEEECKRYKGLLPKEWQW